MGDLFGAPFAVVSGFYVGLHLGFVLFGVSICIIGFVLFGVICGVCVIWGPIGVLFGFCLVFYVGFNWVIYLGPHLGFV